MIPTIVAQGLPVSSLINLVILVIVVGAILYIAQMLITIPPTVMRIIWIVIGVVAAVLAIRYLATLI